MKTLTKVLAAVIGGATLLMQVPAAQQMVGSLMGAHPNVTAVLGGVAALLALLHVPTSPAQ